MADQGLFRIPFQDLPSDVAQFYQSRVVIEPPKPTIPAAVPVQPRVITKSKQPPANPALADLNKKRVRLARLSSITNSINEKERIVDTYTRQSSFGPGKKITSEEYELAKSELEMLRAELAVLNEGK